MEIFFFRKEWDQSLSPVECVSGADMVAGSDSAGVHNSCQMAEPMYQPVAGSDFVVEENGCVVASVDECHMHEKGSGQSSQLDGNFLPLSDPRIFCDPSP